MSSVRAPDSCSDDVDSDSDLELLTESESEVEDQAAERSALNKHHGEGKD